MAGTTEKITGKAEEAAGAILDDDKLRRDGKTDQMAGKAKDLADRAVDAVKDVAHKASDKASEVAQKASDKVKEVAHKITDKTRDMADKGDREVDKV